MDKKSTTKDVLTAFLIVVSLFGIWQFTAVNNELKLSQSKLQHIQTKINQEKEQYELRIDGLNATIETTSKQLENTNKQLERANMQLETSNNKLAFAKTQLKELAILKNEFANLSEIKQELEQKIANLEDEKQATEAKLHSLTELRKLVRQVKAEIYAQNIQWNLAKKKQQREIDAQETEAGNRGFIIKNSKSTYKTSIRIEVKPGS